ncbi:MAG TPA: DUF5979 domain-containing protein [Pseudolysinimonas sp.]|nr:DUF5979 domain-containing protein [Pseudolysinimonas sp.]
MENPKMLTSARSRRTGRIAAAAAALLGLLGGLFASAPAFADDYTAVLQITKTVNKAALVPNDTLVYTIAVDCSTDNCVGARLVDTLPPEWDALTLQTTPAVSGGSSTFSWGGVNNRTLTVDFTKATPGGPGIPAGTGYSVQVSLTVPSNLPADWLPNGVTVTNTARVSATTAAEVSASADAKVTVPYSVNTTAGATWSPTSAQFKVGEPSTLTLTTRNTSNAAATSLRLLAPTDPTAASSLFEYTNLTGFGAVVFPAGADRIQVDAYVAGAWVTGPVGTTAALDGSVTMSDVRGLRITFTSSTGSTLTSNGAAGSVVVQLGQRATTRTAGTSLISGATVTANVTGTVTVPTQPAKSVTTSATYGIGALTSSVSATTTFTGTRVAAGTSSRATLTGRNTSNGPLASMTITQPTSSALLGSKVTFGGFSATGAAWPTGATSATVTWFVDSGAAPAPVVISSTDPLPATPTLVGGQGITGFSVQYAGSIAANATAAVPFTVALAADAVPASPGSGTFTNTIRVDGVNDAGTATPATASATLTVLYPQIGISMTKSVTPSASAPAPAGGRSIVQLRATTSSDSGFVTPTTVTISDGVTGGPADYWSAFNLVGVAPTQVLAGSTLLVQYTLDGTTWTDLGGVTAGASATTYQGVFPTAEAPNIVGVRFVHTKASGFAQSSTLVGNLAFQSRATLRGTATPTATSGSTPSYTNAATVKAVGDVNLPGGGAVSGSGGASSAGGVVWRPAGSGGQLFDKAWTTATVDSQSGQTKVARIRWGTEIDGYSSVAVSDPADPTLPVSQTVFQAFNLQRIDAITTSTDPLIAFDQVADIELYTAAGGWASIKSTVCATASNCQGKLNAYTLTTAQQANTLGVRITFAEWAAGRAASTDPLTPPVGSGVASSPSSRRLDLTFVLRNKVRDASAMADPTFPWTTGTRVYNAVDPGVVSNDAKVTMGAHSASASDTILIFDRPPGVNLTHVAQNSAGAALTGPIAIPSLNDTNPTAYPVVKFSMTGTNASTARAWYLRMTDQMPCSTTAVSSCAHLSVPGTGGWTVNPYAGKTWDAATSPFEYFTIEKVAYTLTSGSGISAGNSSITFWKEDGSNETVALSSPKLTDKAYLADVVGVSAVFASTSTTEGGTIVSGGGATIVLDTRLRKFQRSDDALISGARSVLNSAFAQDWDGVLDDTAAYGSTSASVALTDAQIDVAVTKSFSTASILEASRGTEITTTLHADQGAATASATQVVVSDVDPAFWDAFELRSLTSVGMPLGADRVRVDVQLNGGSSWTSGATVSSAPALPAVTLSQVTGLRVVFTRADGGLFSVTAPAAGWSTDILFAVRLRSADRGTGAAIPFPGSVSNTATATVEHPVLGSDSATATRSLALDPGTFRVDVEKRRSVATSPAGETLEFRLLVKNTGTGYLDNPVVIDQLPIDAGLAAGGPLLFDPTSEVTYSTTAGGILPVTGVGVAYDDTTRRITFSWPSGSRLAPGETYTIVVPLQVAPGLQSTYGDAVNRMTFTSDRTLSGCTNASANGEGVSQPGGAKYCSTTSRVQAVSASAISSFKGVKGDVDAAGVSTSGAVNVNDATTPCVADAQGFYRNPCAANTVVGGTDLWKVQYTNGGNVPALTATVVDVLPKPGDVYLGTGAARGSTFRPVFAGDVTLSALGLAAGTTLSGWQVTTSANPCPSYASNPTCTTASWLDGATYPTGSYGNITALRFQFSFAGVTASPGSLPPAATVAVTYKTVNTPTTSASDNRAPVTAPVTNQRAWNTFGVFATFGPSYTDRRVEPVRAGVQLASGPLQVQKVKIGDGAPWSPTSLAASVTCTVAGVNVVLPASGALTLAMSNGTPYAARLDGIPVGSVCDIAETTTGASAVDYDPAAPGGDAARVTIGTAGGPAAAIPAGQTATVTNTYGTTRLKISKVVTTDADTGSFGPFDFTLSCSANTGTGIVPVVLDPSDAAFTLSANQSRTIVDLPVSATCQVTETDSFHADLIEMSIPGGPATTVLQGQAYTVALGTDPGYAVTVRNTYLAGQVAVSKTVTGSGGADFGTGPFTVELSCTWQGQSLYTTSFTLVDGQTRTMTPVFPKGTSCAIDETDAGGATTPASGTSVIVPGPAGGQPLGLVTAGLTNRFDTGSLKVVKQRTGSYPRYGAGPFQVHVVCTWDKPGASDQVIPLPGGGLVDLTSAGGYEATVTGLIAGADCTVKETRYGGATSHPTAGVAASAITVGGTSTATITNDYATGTLVIDKDRTGPGRDAFGAGPFEVAVSCWYDVDGTATPIAMGADATATLSAGNGYHAEITDLIVGAECTVVETDAGLATSTTYAPGDGTVTIVAAGGTDARVLITNDFQVGALDIEKTASESLVQGGDGYDYEFVVRNVGVVDAADVTVTDVLDPALKVTAIASAGWASCAVAGADGAGFGGTLTCLLNDAGNPVLAAGATAPTITVTVLVLDEIAQDDIVNEAEVTTSTVVVTGDDDSVTTPVKWLDVVAAPQCVQDAPWLTYTVDAHNLDVAGHTMTVDWKDAAGTVIHTDSVPITASGVVHGQLLWPGAEVDANGDGIAWPGWRAALPGETPDWENLVLDPAAYGYGLRSGATVDIHINPSTTVSVTYPPASASCEETPVGRMSDMWLTKTASKTDVAPGGTFQYTIRAGNDGLGAVEDVVLVDDVPDTLLVLAATPVVPTDPAAPAWRSCTVDPGYGGDVRCELDRPLAFGETVPDLVLDVRLDPKAKAGVIVNVVTLTFEESPPNAAARLAGLGTRSLTADATVMTAGLALALTGAGIGIALPFALGLLAAGVLLIVYRRRPAAD